MTKASVHQQDTTTLKGYVHLHNALRHAKQKLTELNGEANSQLQLGTSTILSQGREVVNKSNNQVVYIGHSTQGNRAHTQAHMEYSPTGHVLGHKTNLNKLKKIRKYSICSLTIMDLEQETSN